MNDNTNVPATHRDQLPDHAQRMQDLLGGINNIAHSIEEAGGVASQFPFIGINGDGVWAYGQDRTQVEDGSHWAVDIRTWKHGYIAWPPNTAKERKPLGERMVPASSPLPVLATLPDVGQPYQLQFAFELLCMTGEDAGEMALYKNGSYGAKVVVQTLVEEVRRQARVDQAKLCPVVELQIRSYFHNEWKKTIYNPVLAIQKWITFEEYDQFVDDTGPEDEPAQLQQTAQPQPEPAQPQPQPAQRRTAAPAAPTPQPTPQAAVRGRGRTAAAAPAAPAPVPTPTGRRRPSTRTQPAA